ncbi:hypothetical protein [Streptomyces sp. NPDC005141]
MSGKAGWLIAVFALAMAAGLLGGIIAWTCGGDTGVTLGIGVAVWVGTGGLGLGACALMWPTR